MHYFLEEQQITGEDAGLEAAAPQILNRLKNNLSYFKQLMPNLAERFTNYQPQQFGVFVTANQQLNIAHVPSKTALYPEFVAEACRNDCQGFIERAPVFSLATGLSRDTGSCEDGEAVLMFGLGNGIALKTLLAERRLPLVVVYEPQDDLFFAALQTIDWLDVFNQAARAGTQLILQVGAEALTIAEDLLEARNELGVEQWRVYRHLNHPKTDAWWDFLAHRYAYEKLEKRTYKLNAFDSIFDEVPLFQEAEVRYGISQSLNYQADSPFYESNLALLNTLYPDVATTVEQRLTEETTWSLRCIKGAGYNLWHEQRECFFYACSEAEQKARVAARLTVNPSRNELTVGQRGGKLWRYKHYDFLRRLGRKFEVDTDAHESAGKIDRSLPRDIPSLMIVGAGLGHEVNTLEDNYRVRLLTYVEPNIDMFIASLAVKNWGALIKRAKANRDELVFSLGDDGRHIKNDVMDKYAGSSGHLIANTFFSFPQRQQGLAASLNSLRADMRSLFSWAEYFEQSRFGISHALTNFTQGLPLIRYSDQPALPAFEKCPVFIVGNGPSLDDTITTLKELADESIVISCGTALRSLVKHDIIPDFHAEVEQNRVPVDIVSNTVTAEKLKQIRLLSVISVHPDLAPLFKETWTVFKANDSASLLLGEHAQTLLSDFPQLEHAYPTVTNFALSLLLHIPFSHIYLMGVDLGYVDQDQHHSKNSIYFSTHNNELLYSSEELGKQYEQIPGNFQPLVSTHFQFRVSQETMEQALAEKPANIEVFNCSNGALIRGTMPLHHEYILSESNKELKQQALTALQKTCIDQTMATRLQQHCAATYSHEEFRAELDKLYDMLSKPVDNLADLYQWIESQQNLIVVSAKRGRSLLYHLLSAELHTLHAILVKSYFTEQNEQAGLAHVHEVIALWQELMLPEVEDYLANPLGTENTEWAHVGKVTPI
jgi:hypothetical protein